MEHVKGRFETVVEFKFRFEDIDEFLDVERELTPVEYQRVADSLAANTELPTKRSDGTIAIVRKNFNDSFVDMQMDLHDSIMKNG